VGRQSVINDASGYGLLAAYRRACGLSWLLWSKGCRSPGAVLYSLRDSTIY